MFWATSVNAVAVSEETNGENAVTYPLGGTVDGSDSITIKWTVRLGTIKHSCHDDVSNSILAYYKRLYINSSPERSAKEPG